jgi:small ligand-binding sensory domain FIST
MPFAAQLSTDADTRRALAAVSVAAAKLTGPADLAVAFFSPHHAGAVREIAETLAENLKAGCLIGCQGEAVVGGAREVENQPAISLWLAHWGGTVEVEPVHLTPDQTPDGPSLFGWPDALVESDPAQSILVLLADPYTFPAAELFLPRVNDDYKGLRVHGGMASGQQSREDTTLFLGDEPQDGAVGALIRGPAKVRGVVSQGCRPVGEPWVVTKAKDNVIFELGGKPPVYRLRDLLRDLPAADAKLFQDSPHVGLAMNPVKGRFTRDDFLVRNLYGLDPNNGAIAITDRVRAGQTVQFLVRDAASADDDLRELLKKDGSAAQAALLFTCNGRGTRLFPGRDHDTRAIQAEYGAIPTAGFFAAGEFGPVAGANHLHGFTASVVLFE